MGIGASAAFLAIFAELLETAPGRAWRGRLTNLFEGMAILSLAIGSTLGRVGGGARSAGAGCSSARARCCSSACSLGAPSGPRRAATPPRLEAPDRPARRPAHRRLVPVYIASLSLSLTWSGLFATMAPLLGHARYGLAAGPIGLALERRLRGGAGRAPRGRARSSTGSAGSPCSSRGAVSVAAGGLVLAAGTHPAVFVLGLVLIGGGFAVWMVPAIVHGGPGGHARCPRATSPCTGSPWTRA